ncbi:inosine-uridine preferring nucleoside hydrolase-like [Watersipora subatra]|uniref:inosine-uridine preferring nucleoside hydrolase-like n=1 Tax=Watersipora subatra TaxID=2589382 RepID=UPI00355B70E2
MKKKLIIDCDTGVDDAQALILAALSDDVEIMAITCVFGNNSVTQAAKNTVRVLHEIDCCHIPVYVGCEKPLKNDIMIDQIRSSGSTYHGLDGLGDVPHATTGSPPFDAVIRSEKAATAICRLIHEHPGEITFVALGPLTNLAIAFRLDSSIVGLFKEINIMGGAIHSKGNVTVVGEFNTTADPEAAAIVIEDVVCPTYLFSWETVSLDGAEWVWHSHWLSRDTRVVKFLRQVTAHCTVMDKDVWDVLFCPPDLITMACVIDTSISIKESVHHCFVNCDSNPHTRGQLIVDWRDHLNKKKNITVCLDWSVDRFKELLTKVI